MSTDIWGLGGAWNPISFSVEFISQMRKEQKTLMNGPPSSRQAIAIPKFLTARFMRKHNLIPEDYIHAAVLTTPIEDQAIAQEIATRILFPKKRREKKKTKPSDSDVSQSPTVAQKLMEEMSLLDEMDLDSLDSDLEFDDLLEHELKELEDLFEFLDELYDSKDPMKQSLQELANNRGGEELILHQGIDNEDSLTEFLKDEVLGQVNSLPPDDLINSVKLGWGEEILQRTRSPWEELLLQYALDKPDFKENLENMISTSDLSTGAKALSYLMETDMELEDLQPQLDSLMNKANEIWDIAEISDILNEIPQFDKEKVIENSLADFGRGFRTCDELDKKFDTKLRQDMFDTFKADLDKRKQKPELEDLAMSATNCQDWSDMLVEVISDELEKCLNSSNPVEELSKFARKLDDFQDDLEKLSEPHNQCSKEFQDAAANVATEALNQIGDKEQFLDKIEDFLDIDIKLDKEEIIQMGTEKNVPIEEIAELFGGDYEILKSFMEANIGDFGRYSKMLKNVNMSEMSLDMSDGFSRPSRMSQDDNRFEELVQTAIEAGNQEALAALAHANLQRTLDTAQQLGGNDMAQSVVDSMSRGPGENLLMQWFYHRNSLPAHVKKRVKDLATKALIEVAMNWPTGKIGSGERGLVPNLELRPFRDGDELDQIDIDSTIEGILLGGKTPEMITTDDLMVWDTSRGRVAACILLDVSGSMANQKLAMCAIAVVMLIGKLKSEEVAIALFESNTHVIKRFDNPVELDEVADELLELKSMGGTVMEGALRWGADQLEECTEAEEKLLMAFTDACIEPFKEIEEQLKRYVDQQVRFIISLDSGYSCNPRAEEISEAVNGEIIILKSIHEIPKILADVLSEIK